MWTTIEPQNIDDLCAQLHGHISNHRDFIYRGQSNSTWHLRPTIVRDLEDYFKDASEEEKLMRECQAIDLFRCKAKLHLHSFEVDMLKLVSTTLILMQHYGGSTRLLDWSNSPWIAAYFAAIDHPQSDGAIWAVNSVALEKSSPSLNLATQSSGLRERPMNFLEVMAR